MLNMTTWRDRERQTSGKREVTKVIIINQHDMTHQRTGVDLVTRSPGPDTSVDHKTETFDGHCITTWKLYEGKPFGGRPARRWRDKLDDYWMSTIWQRTAQDR